MRLLSIGSTPQGECARGVCVYLVLFCCHCHYLFGAVIVCTHSHYDVCACTHRYTQVSLMLLLSKLQSSEGGGHQLTKAPITKDQLCDSLDAMDLGGAGNTGMAVVNMADI